VSAAAGSPLRKYGFPYRAPTVPRGVVVPKEPPNLGADYDTEWARGPVARVARGVIIEGPSVRWPG
jgi:1-acyl-sn-glycerol-3-phosphate acyltransferase